MTDRGFAERSRQLLAGYGFRLQAPIGYRELAPAFGRDKKKRGGKMRLVIPCGLCDVRIREADEQELSLALDEGGSKEQGAGAS